MGIVEQLRVPPNSIIAEQAVLGALLLDNESWEKIAEKISESDFYNSTHQIIFRAIYKLSLNNKPSDIIPISEYLEDIGVLDDCGGIFYLNQLTKNTPTSHNIETYAEIVIGHAVCRRLITAANNIASSIYDPNGKDTHQLIDMAEESILSVARDSKGIVKSGEPVPINMMTVKTLKKIEERFESGSALTGVSSGFTEFDGMTSGLQAGELIIIAGRPSMGKTAFAMNIAEHISIKEDKSVLIFSMEMSYEQLIMRMYSSLGKIDLQKIRTGKINQNDWSAISSLACSLNDKKIFVDEQGALSPIDIKTKARRLIKKHGELGIIIIDYLQLMHVAGYRNNRVGEISEISRSLKCLAKELDVPVIAISQLSRSTEQRTDKRPIMSDLRDSGAIEQDADLIAFIYRDEVYNRESAHKGTAEVIIAKQRNGPVGTFCLTFLGHYSRFENFRGERVEI